MICALSEIVAISIHWELLMVTEFAG